MSTSTYVSHTAVKLILERYLSEDLVRDALVKIDPSRCVELPVPAERDWATLAGPVLRFTVEFADDLERLRRAISVLEDASQCDDDPNQTIAEALVESLNALREEIRDSLEEMQESFEGAREPIGHDDVHIDRAEENLLWKSMDGLLQTLADHKLLRARAVEGSRAARDTLPANVRAEVERYITR